MIGCSKFSRNLPGFCSLVRSPEWRCCRSFGEYFGVRKLLTCEPNRSTVCATWGRLAGNRSKKTSICDHRCRPKIEGTCVVLSGEGQRGFPALPDASQALSMSRLRRGSRFARDHIRLPSVSFFQCSFIRPLRCVKCFHRGYWLILAASDPEKSAPTDHGKLDAGTRHAG